MNIANEKLINPELITKISSLLELDYLLSENEKNVTLENCSGRNGWQIQPSYIARHTINQIRSIVEGMMVEPHPEKQMIALSIGKFGIFSRQI